MRSVWRSVLAVFGLLAVLPCAAQNCGWSRIDHEVSFSNSGVWNPNVYRSIVDGLTIAQIGGALWEGSQSRFGKTMWQGIDAEIVADASAAIGKLIFTRARPNQGGNPCLWFQGKNYYSFPSGEASVAAGLVTPYVLEYGDEQPAVYALLMLPLYVGAGRIKGQDHWQSDVIAAWAVGGLSGWLAHSLETPILIQLLPHGFAIGIQAQF